MKCALIDTGSMQNVLVKHLLRSFPLKYILHLDMLPWHHFQTCKIVGYCVVKLVVEDNIFNNTKLLVMENLYKEVILGYELMNHLESVQIW